MKKKPVVIAPWGNKSWPYLLAQQSYNKKRLNAVAFCQFSETERLSDLDIEEGIRTLTHFSKENGDPLTVIQFILTACGEMEYYKYTREDLKKARGEGLNKDRPKKLL